MASVPALTPNSISAIANGDTNLRPLLQVLDVKEIMASRSEKRFRLLLSDGSLVQQGVLATQLNPSVSSGQVKRGSILQLLDYVCHTLRGLRFVMVLNMETIGFSAEVLGNPKKFPFNEGETSIENNADICDNEAKRCRREDEKLPARVFDATANASPPPATSSPMARPVVSPLIEPAPVYSNKGPIARNQAPATYLPIVALTPYIGRWAIKARVTAKTDLRRFHTARGDGRVFSFDLLDGDGGEIRATCFNATADQFMNIIEVGKLYIISKGKLKPAERNFNHLRHDFEITLESSSIIEPLNEADDSIPHQQFRFTPIAAIENAEENATVDVLGVVVGVSSTNTILRKNGTETEKRTVHLRDASNFSVEITLWGSYCSREGSLLQEAWNSGQTTVLAVKAGRISAFSGKSVGTISSTQLLVDPDLPEAKQLRAWFDSGGKTSVFQPISHEGAAGMHVEMRKSVAQIKDEGLGRSGKPDWIAVKGTVSFVKTDKFCYTACPLTMGDRQCNRKVTRRSDGKWHCDRCDSLTDDCEYRYLLSFQVQDHTGVTWVTAFQEAAEDIMGVSAKVLQSWKDDCDARFEDAVQKVLFSQKLFKLKVKEETYNDELSVKCSVLKVEELDYLSENKHVLDSIRSLMLGECDKYETAGNGRVPLTSNNATGFVSSAISDQYVGASPIKYTSSKASRSSGGVSGDFNSATSSCFRCGKAGHWARDCPNLGSRRFR